MEKCDWREKGNFQIHEKSKTHVSLMEKADNLVVISHEKRLDNNRFISKAYDENVSRNRQIVLATIDVVVILGQRNIAFRGYWDKELKTVDGNFGFFVDWVSKFDDVLRAHLQSPGPHYLSPKIQAVMFRGYK